MNYSDAILPMHVDGTSYSLAVSGGADSMYMVMRFLSEFGAGSIIALIVDHGLRENSAAEAKWVAAYLHTKGVRAEILKLQFTDPPKSNLQKIARDMRYKCLLRYCEKNNLQNLCFAHNLDDQLETIFMKLERGSGVDGACGIAQSKQYGNVILHRPILHVSRETIEQELKANNWEWVEDPSNENVEFKRVKVRKFLRKYEDYETLRNRAALFAKNMQRARDFIEQEVKKAKSELLRIDELCYAEIDYIKFQQLHEELRYRIFIDALQNISGNYLKPRLQKLAAILQNINDASCGISDQLKQTWTFGGCQIIYKEAKLYVMRELDAMDNVNTANEALIGFSCYDNRFRILKNDAQIKPLSLAGYSWLRKQIKLPKQISNMIYQTLPAIYDDKENIVAVYGLYGDWQKYLEYNMCAEPTISNK